MPMTCLSVELLEADLLDTGYPVCMDAS